MCWASASVAFAYGGRMGDVEGKFFSCESREGSESELTNECQSVVMAGLMRFDEPFSAFLAIPVEGSEGAREEHGARVTQAAAFTAPLSGLAEQLWVGRPLADLGVLEEAGGEFAHGHRVTTLRAQFCPLPWLS